MDQYNRQQDDALNETPHLRNLKDKQSVFQVPENYFDTQSQALHSLLEDQMYLEQEAPILAKISKKNVFQVPAGYWENFTTEIQENVKPRSRTIIKTLNTRFSSWGYSIAAAILVLLLGIWVIPFIRHTDPASQMDLETSLASIPTEALWDEVASIGHQDTRQIVLALQSEGIEPSQIGYLPDDWLTEQEAEKIFEEWDLSEWEENY